MADLAAVVDAVAVVVVAQGNMKSKLLLIIGMLLASCASDDPLWSEQQVIERYEALVYACKQVGGAIAIDRHSTIRAKMDKPPTKWEMRTARCVTLN